MNPKLTAVLLTMTLAALVACGDDKKKPEPAAGGGGKDAAPAAGSGQAYDAAKATASVKVTVKWTGAKTEPQKITMSGDAFCTGLGSTDDPRFAVNADGTLPNAFVWAKDGPHKGMTGLPESEKVTLDQHGCMYMPHVFGLRTGQAFTIKNSDNTTHNVHPRPKNNDPFNQAQAQGATNEFTFKQKEKAIQFACDIHSWMSAWAFVVDHPFFGTTGADGTVTIGKLPPGKYKFVAWHEAMSADSKGHEVEFDVEVAAGDTKAVGADLK
jgi:plastocyanin